MAGQCMHENHRKRMMERYLKTGFDSFADHEVLEMLLYYSKPRCDTNETAHLLLERFGRIDGVFEATPEELMQIDGIGQSSAVLMQLIRESARRYTKAVMQNRKRFMHIREVAEFANSCFVGSTTEQLYLFLFNNGMEMIDSVLLTTGTINSAEMPARLMLEKAIHKRASCAVLAHNHPHGIAVPSDSDIQLTYHAAEVLGLIHIPLFEHLVFAENRYACIMKSHYRLQANASIPGFSNQVSFLVNLDDFLKIEDDECVIPDPFELNEAKKKEENQEK